MSPSRVAHAHARRAVLLEDEGQVGDVSIVAFPAFLYLRTSRRSGALPVPAAFLLFRFPFPQFAEASRVHDTTASLYNAIAQTTTDARVRGGTGFRSLSQR